jgi:hypothetical protein
VCYFSDDTGASLGPNQTLGSLAETKVIHSFKDACSVSLSSASVCHGELSILALTLNPSFVPNSSSGKASAWCLVGSEAVFPVDAGRGQWWALPAAALQKGRGRERTQVEAGKGPCQVWHLPD